MSESEKKSPVQSVSRAAEILRCFSNRQEIGLTEISKLVGLNKSTTSGLVNALKLERFLDQNPANGKYRLGIDLFRLGVTAQSDIRTVSRPYLQQLLAAYQETVNLAVLDGDAIVYVEKIESGHSMRICTRIGQRVPFYCTANGKCMAAFLPAEQLEQMLDGLTPEPFTAHTITERGALLAALETIRRDGYACDNEEYEEGLICVAAPILGQNGEAVAAISVSGPSPRMGEAVRKEIARTLCETAAEISARLA